MQEFISRFITLVRKDTEDSLIVLVEATNYKTRKYIRAATCEPEDITSFIEEHKAVSFTTADEDKILEKYSSIHQTALDDKDPDWLQFQVAKNIDEMCELLPKTPYTKGASTSDITYKPVLMVDIDLHDLKDKLVAYDTLLREETKGMNDKEFKAHLKDLPGDVKLKYVKKLIPINLIVAETNPMLVMFSGNGVHLWYYTPFKLTPDMYKHIHSTIRKEIVGLIPELKIDESATMLNQNIRLPFTQNLKGKTPIPCEILHEASKPTISHLVQESKKTYKPTGPKKAASIQRGKIREFIDNPRTFYTGLRNIQRDKRAYTFVKEYLTFENILEYTGTPVDQLTVHADYLMCCSPLREDDNPSFLVSPERMMCTDLGRGNEEMDYGQVMQRLLKIKKIKLRMPSTTTRYEAEIHVMICAYINYVMKTGSTELPMCDLKLHKQMVEKIMADEGLTKPPANLKQPPGLKYYQTLQSQIYTWLEYKDRHPETGSEGLLEHLLNTVPEVYYFFDQGRGSSPTSYVQNVIALALISYVNKLGLGICMIEDKFELYVQNKKGLHGAWNYSVGFGGEGDSKYKESAVAQLQCFLMDINALYASALPPGTPPLSKYLFSILSGISALPPKIYSDIQKMTHPSDQGIKKALSSRLSKLYAGIHVSAKDLNVSVLSSDKYLEFNNYFVLYESDNIDRIGEKLPNTVESRESLMKRAIVDTRIPLDYPKEPKDTPLFNRYIKSMTYEDNNFDKAIAYFVGSMLYLPTPETRAVFLYGRSGDNGKSVFAETLGGVLGNKSYVTQKNIAHISADTETSKTARAEMTEAIVNITPDSTKQKIGPVFKQLIVGEAIQVRKLYGAERDIQLRCHFLVMTNTLPGTQSDTFPFKKRGLIVKVNHTVPVKDRIPELGKKIVDQEAGDIWPWIIENCKKFKRGGLAGFLDGADIEALEKEILDKDELYNFIRDYVQYDPQEPWVMRETTFKRMYNKYRAHVDKNLVRSDSIFDDAELYIQKVFSGLVPDRILEKGFGYRTSAGRGLPLRVFVPARTVGNAKPIDSEVEIG